MKYVVKGQSPEGSVYERGSCGWRKQGRGRRYSKWEAEAVAREVNFDGEFIAWATPAGEMVDGLREEVSL